MNSPAVSAKSKNNLAPPDPVGEKRKLVEEDGKTETINERRARQMQEKQGEEDDSDDDLDLVDDEGNILPEIIPVELERKKEVLDKDLSADCKAVKNFLEQF